MSRHIFSVVDNPSGLLRAVPDVELTEDVLGKGGCELHDHAVLRRLPEELLQVLDFLELLAFRFYEFHISLYGSLVSISP